MKQQHIISMLLLITTVGVRQIAFGGYFQFVGYMYIHELMSFRQLISSWYISDFSYVLTVLSCTKIILHVIVHTWKQSD